jgi:hypothetical protein
LMVTEMSELRLQRHGMHLGPAYDPAPMELASADHSSGVTRPR